MKNDMAAEKNETFSVCRKQMKAEGLSCKKSHGKVSAMIQTISQRMP